MEVGAWSFNRSPNWWREAKGTLRDRDGGVYERTRTPAAPLSSQGIRERFRALPGRGKCIDDRTVSAWRRENGDRVRKEHQQLFYQSTKVQLLVFRSIV